MLPAPFDGFGVLGNVTLQKDRGFKGTNLLTGELLPYPGLSRTSYNAGVYYEDARISARLSYNWRSRWLITASGRGGLPEYNDAFGTMDMSVDYNLTKQVTVFVDGVNLTNAAYIQENDPLRRLSNETDGLKVFFGVRFRN
jgi:outer membrane receptor protein involved in Fe transport